MSLDEKQVATLIELVSLLSLSDILGIERLLQCFRDLSNRGDKKQWQQLVLSQGEQRITRAKGPTKRTTGKKRKLCTEAPSQIAAKLLPNANNQEQSELISPSQSWASNNNPVNPLSSSLCQRAANTIQDVVNLEQVRVSSTYNLRLRLLCFSHDLDHIDRTIDKEKLGPGRGRRTVTFETISQQCKMMPEQVRCLGRRSLRWLYIVQCGGLWSLANLGDNLTYWEKLYSYEIQEFFLYFHKCSSSKIEQLQAKNQAAAQALIQSLLGYGWTASELSASDSDLMKIIREYVDPTQKQPDVLVSLQAAGCGIDLEDLCKEYTKQSKENKESIGFEPVDTGLHDTTAFKAPSQLHAVQEDKGHASTTRVKDVRLDPKTRTSTHGDHQTAAGVLQSVQYHEQAYTGATIGASQRPVRSYLSHPLPINSASINHAMTTANDRPARISTGSDGNRNTLTQNRNLGGNYMTCDERYEDIGVGTTSEISRETICAERSHEEQNQDNRQAFNSLDAEKEIGTLASIHTGLRETLRHDEDAEQNQQQYETCANAAKRQRLSGDESRAESGTVQNWAQNTVPIALENTHNSHECDRALDATAALVRVELTILSFEDEPIDTISATTNAELARQSVEDSAVSLETTPSLWVQDSHHEENYHAAENMLVVPNTVLAANGMDTGTNVVSADPRMASVFGSVTGSTGPHSESFRLEERLLGTFEPGSYEDDATKAWEADWFLDLRVE